MIDIRPACDAMIAVLSHTAGEHLTRPTPCSEYTVADLVDHVRQVAKGFAAVAGGHSPGDQRDDVAGDVRALGEAWADPAAWQGTTDTGGLELSNELWGRIALTEVVVHGWDLARAIGQPFEPPEPTLRACLSHVEEFVPNAPVPELWGPAVAVPAGAALLDRIVAATGRVP